MSRVKRGLASHAKHKKLHELTAGYRMTKSRLIKVAQEAVLHAGEYAHTGRKLKKRDMRSLWILRINQATQQMDLSYSRFINALKKAEIPLDRKILSELAVKDPEVFKVIVDKVRAQVN
jgi:large subunit ribosomal protein L20